MFINRLKMLITLLILGLVLLIAWEHGGIRAAAAAEPKFKRNEVELNGIGEVYDLEILNKVKNSTYKWSSSNERVAKVSANGTITAVGIGTAKIQCKITYESGKTKTLTCNVTVSVPATDIMINNVTITNGAHRMMVGETYDFNCSLTPINSTDKVIWSLDTTHPEANINAVRIDNSEKGIVTALRRGIITLVATVVKDTSEKSIMESDIKDAVIIEVVGPSAEVVSAKILDSKTIRIEFGTEIRESTVIKSDGTLSDNIILDQLFDPSGKKAADPGSLTAILSKNLRTLTITASKSFNGYYGLTFSNGILTSGGSPIYKDYMRLSYLDNTSDEDAEDSDTDTDEEEEIIPDIDTVAPTIATTSLEDDGMTNIITFSEKMDFSRIQVSNAKVAYPSTALPTSISYLNNELNYGFGADGKSIIINMSGINSEDYNKSFIVTISGIIDLAGNSPKNGSVEVLLRTNTAPMPQAVPLSIIRTSYNTVTATFSRSIRKPGMININNGGSYYGKINPENNRQVIYTFSDYEASLTGVQTVSIGLWDSYNVNPNDTIANEFRSFNVNFTHETIKPVLLSYNFNSVHRILTLTYSETVNAYAVEGSIPYTMTSYKYDDLSGNIEYSVINTIDNVIEIVLKNITIYGNYTFTLPEGFVLDKYRNPSINSRIILYNITGESGDNKLPEPYSIYQSDVNHSIIYVEFADKLDVASALDETNYNLAGAEIEEIKLIKNDADGAKIQLVLVKGSIAANGKCSIRISGIRGFNGSYTEMTDYITDLDLYENTDPQLKSISYDPVAKDTIKLIFTENITGSLSVLVQERSTGFSIGNTVIISGDTASIKLNYVPADGTHLQIYILDNRIVDLNGNESTLLPVLNTFVNY